MSKSFAMSGIFSFLCSAVVLISSAALLRCSKTLQTSESDAHKMKPPIHLDLFTLTSPVQMAFPIKFQTLFQLIATTGTTWFSPNSSKFPFQLPLRAQLLPKHPFNREILIHPIQQIDLPSHQTLPPIPVPCLFQALIMLPCWSTGAQKSPLFLPLQSQHLCHHSPQHPPQQGPHHPPHHL